jgi:hypothetical protein
VCLSVCVRACMCVFVCMHACVRVCVCVYLGGKGCRGSVFGWEGGRGNGFLDCYVSDKDCPDGCRLFESLPFPYLATSCGGHKTVVSSRLPPALLFVARALLPDVPFRLEPHSAVYAASALPMECPQNFHGQSALKVRNDIHKLKRYIAA